MTESRKTRSMTFLTVGTVVVLLMAGGTAGAAAGMHGHGNPHSDHGQMEMHHQMLMEGLDLTEVQRDRIHQVMKEHHEAVPAGQVEAMHEAHAALAELIHDPAATDAQVLEAARKVSEFQEQMALESHKMATEIFEILTEEQRQKLLELKDQMKDHHGAE